MNCKVKKDRILGKGWEIVKLSQRELNVLDYLIKQEDYVNYKDIASSFTITERMARYDIEKIDFFLISNELPPLNRSLKKGLMVGKRDELHHLVQEFKKRTTPELYKYSKEEIKEFILLTLLLIKNPVSISYFEQVLYISRTSVLNNIKMLEEQLSAYGLELTHIKRKGFQVIGGVSERAHSFSNILLESINLRELYTFIETEEMVFSKKSELIIFNLFELDLLFSSYGTVKKVEKFMGKEFDDSFNTFVLTVIYQIYIEDSDWELGGFLLKIKEELSESEKFLRLIMNESPDILPTKTDFNVRKSVYDLIGKMSIYFDQDVSSFTSKFQDQLTAHISNMIDRNKKGIKVYNPIYKEIISDYPDLFEKIQNSISDLERYYKIKISMHEISFLVIYFASEMENHNIENIRKPNILIVCVEGVAVSKMLQVQLSKVFEFNKIETSSLKNFSIKDLEVYDYILSTIEIPDITSEKIIKINNYLTEADIKLLKSLFTAKILNSKNRDLNYFNKIMESIRENTNEITNLSKLELDLIKILTKKNKLAKKELISEIYFSVDNISIIDTRVRWESAIQVGTDGLEKESTLPSYRERIMSNIRNHGPYMVIAPKVMIAHAGMEDGVKQAGLWVTTLKEGTNLSGNFSEEVKLIITIALKDRSTHRIMENIAKLAFNNKKIEAIISSNNTTDIYHMVMSEIYK